MNVALLIQRQSMLLFLPDRDAPVTCPIPTTVIHDLEVLNEAELETLMGKIMPPQALKSQTQAILLLDDTICFTYRLEPAKEEEMKKTLLNDVPFLHVASTTISSGAESIFVTTNQDLYESVARALEAKKYSVIGVYPWASLQYLQIVKAGEAFSAATTKRLFDATATLRPVAFPYKHEVNVDVLPVTVTKSPERARSKKGWVIFISIALLYIVVMLIIVVLRR